MNAFTLVLAMLPTADPSPPTAEIPAAARPTFYPGAVFDLSPDGKTAVTLMSREYYQQYLRLRDIETGAIVGDLWLGKADTVTSAKFSPDGKTVAVALGPHGGVHHVRLLDVRGGSAVREFHGFENNVQVRGFSPDGTKLVTLDYPGPGSRKSFKPRLDTWDVPTGKRLDTAEGAYEERLSAATPDGKVTAGRTEKRDFVVTRDGKQTTIAADPNSVYYGVFLTPDGKRVVLATHAWATVFDTATGDPVRTLRSDTQVVTSAVPADGGKLLFVAVSAGRNSDRRLEPEAAWVCVWDTTKPELRAAIPVHGSLRKVQPTADGKRFTVIGGDNWNVNAVEVWDTAGKKRLHAFDLPEGRNGWAAMSQDGNWVALASAADEKVTLRVWNTETGKPAEEVQKAAGPFGGSIAFTPDSKRLVTVTVAEYAEWSLATGKKEAGWKWGKGNDEPRGLGGYVGSVTALPGGKGVFAVTATGKRRQSYVLSLATEKKQWHLGEVWDHASDPVVSADGRWLAVVAGSPRDNYQAMLLRVEDDGSPELMKKPDRYYGPVYEGDKVPAWRTWDVDAHTGVVAFSPDGKRLYTGGMSHALQIWDTEAQALKATLYTVPAAKPGDPPTDWVAYTPAGHFAASLLGEKVLRFRDGTVETWFGFRRPAGSVPAADLPQFRDPGKVREALAGK